MRTPNAFSLFKVCQSTGYLEQAMGRPQGQSQALAGIFQPGLVDRFQRTVATQAVEVEKGIGAALAPLL